LVTERWAVLLAVAAGGALGAVLRFLLAQWLNLADRSLPWGTILANLLGAFLAGLLLAWLETRTWSMTLRYCLQVGFLGALTTYSTFSVETLNMLQKGKPSLALAHIAINLLGSLFMVWLGHSLLRGR
jgi:CrcB protein